VDRLHQLAETQVDNDHRYKGFNLFAEEDASLFRLLLSGEVGPILWTTDRQKQGGDQRGCTTAAQA
jgi:hypothetical protein